MNGVTTRARFALALIMLGSSTGAAAERPTRPVESDGRRPRVSPYLNLVNNQQPGATNYQSLVRPQVEQQSVSRSQRAAVQQLNRQAAATRSQSTPQGNRQLRGTGHSTRFDDTSRYFPATRK